MAKITDYAAVQAEIARQLTLNEYTLVDVLGMDLAVLAVLNIYMTNDVCKGFGQDFKDTISVISSRERISIISGRKSSNYKDDGYICLYIDLADDIDEILMVIQTVFDRLPD